MKYGLADRLYNYVVGDILYIGDIGESGNSIELSVKRFLEIDPDIRVKMITSCLRMIFLAPLVIPVFLLAYLKEDYFMPVIWKIRDSII